MMIEPLVSEYFNVKRSYHYSVLPTATPYSRNAIFSGLFPVGDRLQVQGQVVEWRQGR